MEIKKTRILSFDRESKNVFLSKIKDSDDKNRIDRVLYIIGNEKLNINDFNEKGTYTVVKEIVNEQGHYCQILLYKGGKFKNFISNNSDIKNAVFVYYTNKNIDYSRYGNNVNVYDNFEES